MADIQKMIDDKYYLRSVLINMDANRFFNNNKEKYDNDIELGVDNNFRLIQKDDKNRDNKYDISKRGDDWWQPDELFCYEGYIVNILRYITDKYKSIKTLKGMVFDNNFHTHHHQTIDVTTLGFCVTNNDNDKDKDNIFTFYSIYHEINSIHNVDKVILERNREIEFSETHSEFFKRYKN